MCFPRLGILVELVQGIEAAEAGPCVHALRVHPSALRQSPGLPMDWFLMFMKAIPVMDYSVVGDLHPACVGGESSGLGSGASGLIPNLDEKRVLVDKLQKVHLGACARPGHPDGAARVRSHLWVQEPVQALSALHGAYVGAHDEAGVGPQIDLLGQKRPGLRRVLLTPGDEPVQRREALEHGRQLVHEDLTL